MRQLVHSCEAERSVWKESDDGFCVLHTAKRVEATEELETAISQADRIDGLEFGHQTLSEGFRFEDMILLDANFQNADLTGCVFRNTEIINSRFEGTSLTNTYFGLDDKDSEDQGVVYKRIGIESSNFSGADLSDATFQKVNLMGSEFDCEDMRSASFIDCGLSELTFIEEDLRDSTFSYSILRLTTFDGCDLHNSVFHAAKLDQTRFGDSMLKHADLRNAILDQTELRNIEINHRTQFDRYLVQEYLADCYSEGTLDKGEIEDPKQYLHTRRNQIPISFAERRNSRARLQRLRDAVVRFPARFCSQDNEPDFAHLEHARYRYRDLSQVCSANGEPEWAREYSIREKHAKRKNAFRNDESSWLWLSTTRWTMKYGEEPTQPLRIAGMIVILSAGLYPLFGVQQEGTEQVIRYCLDCGSSLSDTVDVAISIGYLSIVRLFALRIQALSLLALASR